MARNYRATDSSAGGDSLLGDLRALAEDGRTLIEAELAYQKARLSYVARRGKTIAALAVMALFFAFFALMALVVGLLLALAPLLTAWGAMLVVTLGLGVLAAGCLAMAVAGFKKTQAIAMDDPDAENGTSADG